MRIREHLLGCILIFSAACCSGAQSTEAHRGAPASPESDPPSDAAPTSPDPARRAPDLDWDSARGWELPQAFPPGELSGKRDPDLFLRLAYASLDSPEILRLHLTPGIENRSLIASPNELCHPNLAAVLSELRPSRLLLRIKGEPTPDEWNCLADLPDIDLYLTLCPNKAYPTLYQCDGDAQLDAMEKRPELRRRVRGLAVSFDEPRHWATLSQFPRLTMLTVRGPAVGIAPEIDEIQALCALPELAYVDFFDAGQLPHRAELPLACAFGLETYRNMRFVSDWEVHTAPPPGFPSCRLRRIEVFSIRDRDRAWLQACPDADVDSVEAAVERLEEERRQRGR
jgi:hypothetical protein